MPAARRIRSADEPGGCHSGAARCGGQHPFPRSGRILMLCPELIPESSEVLSLTMKPNNLSPLHKRKKPASVCVLPQ